MNVYEEYAKLKTQVKVAQDRLKEIEPVILEEIKSLSAPMKNEFGTYTKVVRETWKYTDSVKTREEVAKIKVEEIMATVEKVKEEERNNGKATKTEIVGLRFIESK